MVGLKFQKLNSNNVFNFRKILLPIRRSLHTKSPTLNYCIDLVRKNDYENFVCSLLLPVQLATAGIVLRAFNVEIATVQDHISETIIGEMRFQFWNDTVDKVFTGKVPEHPVAIELAKVVSENKLSKIYLKRLIAARRNYLLSPHFDTMQKITEYADMTNSPIYFLLLELADIQKVDADHAASHLGKAQGLTNLLRGTLYNSRKNVISIPQEVLIKHKVSQEDIFRNKITSNTRDLFFDIASEAHLHLNSVKKMQKKLDKTCRRIFLPVVAIENYLKKLQFLDFDVYHPKLQNKDELLSLKLFWRKLLL